MFACLDGLLLLILWTKIPFPRESILGAAWYGLVVHLRAKVPKFAGTGTFVSGIDSRPPRKSC
jgi:hypothetical protein